MMVIVFVFSVWIRRLRPIFPLSQVETLPRSTRTMTGQRPTSIVDLTAQEPCRIFTFAKHVSFEHSTGIPCPVISSRREGNINKRTKLKSFLTLDRRSVSPHRPACVRALRGQWAIWLAPRLSLATESTGTVLIPSQMSEIAGHGRVCDVESMNFNIYAWRSKVQPHDQESALLQNSSRENTRRAALSVLCARSENACESLRFACSSGCSAPSDRRPQTTIITRNAMTRTQCLLVTFYSFIVDCFV